MGSSRDAFGTPFILFAITIVALSGIVGAAVAAIDREEWVRWGITVALLAGAGMGFRVSSLYMVGEKAVPALLLITTILFGALFLQGIGWALVALSELLKEGNVSVHPTLPTIIAFGCYSVLASAVALIGTFLQVGYGRGWVGQDVRMPFIGDQERHPYDR